MLSFKVILQKFASNGDKTGWTYLIIPEDIITKLKLKSRKEFRIKGSFDDVKVERMACFPMRDGNFMIPVNATLRKKLGKKEGATVAIKFELDERGALQSKELMDCLQEEPEALSYFNTLTRSHQNYFHTWINSAKGIDTRAGRIVNSISAMLKKQTFGEMSRSLQKKNL